MTPFFNPQVSQPEPTNAKPGHSDQNPPTLAQQANPAQPFNMPAMAALGSVLVAFVFFSMFGTSDAANPCYVFTDGYCNSPDQEPCNGSCTPDPPVPKTPRSWTCSTGDNIYETLLIAQPYAKDPIAKPPSESPGWESVTGQSTKDCVEREVCQTKCSSEPNPNPPYGTINLCFASVSDKEPTLVWDVSIGCKSP